MILNNFLKFYAKNMSNSILKIVFVLNSDYLNFLNRS